MVKGDGNMKILFASGEALPYVATGGLADVAGSLPRAENSEGCDCRVVLPLYGSISRKLRSKLKYKFYFYVPLSWRNQYCGVFEGEDNGVKYYLLDNEYYFKRPKIYGEYDDAERFAFFSRAVLELIRHIDFKPDIIHANDWHTALIPVFHRVFYTGIPEYARIKTVFTIHNVQYQGKYGAELYEDLLGLPGWAAPILDYDACLNFVKGAVVTAGAVTTVSPTYARELRYPFFAYGLHHILSDCSYKFTGIVNGIDTERYDPKTDKSVFKNYAADDGNGKAENKRALQELLGLTRDDGAMLIGMVTRLVEHKGIELVKFVFDELMKDHVQIVVLGTGEQKYEEFFTAMQGQYPGKVAARIGFLQDLARKVYAGADALLMPSKMEPCGLAQMVALRYGTIPVVRETGGLGDSIRDCGTDASGNGYTFKTYNAHDMLGAVRRAEGAFVNREYWHSVVSTAVQSDFTWTKSAREYINLYKQLLED